LPELLDDNQECVFNGNWTASRKMDGIRCSCICSPDSLCVPLSRNGKEFHTLSTLKNIIGKIDSDYYGNPTNDGNIGLCLYNYGEDCLTYEDKNFIYDKDTNKILARLATSRYFNNNNYSDADVNALNANQAQLEKFYYTTKTATNYDDEGYARGTVTSSLLPNYIVDNKIGGMHGVPYVKGPFITLDKLSGKHKLGWV
jgi:hypothetical protein